MSIGTAYLTSICFTVCVLLFLLHNDTDHRAGPHSRCDVRAGSRHQRYCSRRISDCHSLTWHRARRTRTVAYQMAGKMYGMHRGGLLHGHVARNAVPGRSHQTIEDDRSLDLCHVCGFSRALNPQIQKMGRAGVHDFLGIFWQHGIGSRD
jgi:hypothetical protein